MYVCVRVIINFEIPVKTKIHLREPRNYDISYSTFTLTALRFFHFNFGHLKKT